MKKWYPPLVFGALLFMLCSMSIQGTLSSSVGADKLKETTTLSQTTIEVNSTLSTTSYSMMAPDTQFINMPLSASRKEIIKDCDATVVFQNRFEHLYPDTVAHRDTLTICPPNATKRVFISFTDFEVAPGDTLFVYDADSILASRQVYAFSGNGVSATGGWIRSECNPSGCLTFQFVTNGDNVKGRGWESWVTCDSLATTEIVCPDIPSKNLECDERYTILKISPPKPIEICGETIDSFCLTIYNAHNHPCLDTCIKAPAILTDNSPAIITDTFGIGIYKAVWRAKKYPVYKKEKYFAVQAPTLVCNDRVYTPLGAACALDIYPDMLLENPCDTITDTLYYRIEIEFNTPKGKKIFVGGGGPGIPYPTLSRDTLRKLGISDMCKGSVEARIFQVYYEHSGDMSICNGGKVENSCSTIVDFEDLSPPFFYDYTPIDTLAVCDTMGIMEAIKNPRVADNCDTGMVALGKIELIDPIGPCGTGRILIAWKAVDLCGNVGLLYDSITIVRPTQFYNPGRTKLNCNEGRVYTDAETPGLLVGEIRNGVLTPRDTVHLSTKDYTCGYILVPNDEQYPSDCGEKWVRNWKVLDWCNPGGGPTRIATQAVLITDTIPPTFIDCPDSSAIGGANNPMLVDLAHFECEINMTPERLGIPRAIDNCDPNPTVTMFRIDELWHGKWDSLGTNLSNSGPLFCDTFRIGWVANDACHEQPKQDTCYKYVIIRDVTKPTAICVDQLNFSVGNDWARVLNIDDIDAGSWDACGIAKREISFDGINWGPTATLACEAIHDDPRIHLRVTDTKGNQNICWTKINVKDDIYPSCGKLPDVDLFCDEFKTGELGASTDTNENGLFDDSEYIPLTGAKLDSFNIKYGNPIDICDDNIKCHPMKIEQEYQLAEWPCGQTRILRRYRAIDWGPNKSPWETQLIALQYRPNWKITLPKDWQGDCGEGFPEGKLDIDAGICDQIGYEVEDKVFDIKEDACYKVERTFHIINWCLYKAGDKPVKLDRREDDHRFVDSTRMIIHDSFPNVGYFTYIQVLKVHSFGGPDITINEVESCLSGDGIAHQPIANDTVVVDPYQCNEFRTFTAEAVTCVEFATLDFWWAIYIDHIKVDSGQGSKFQYPVNPGREYKVRFSATDGCGNGATEFKKFEFFDCKKPTPYCRAGVGIEMGQEGKVTIWASDIDLNSFDNCTSMDSLRRRVWHTSLGEPPATIDDVLALPQNIDFNCDYFGSQVVRLYIIDKANLYAYCAGVVDVQDNMRVCQPQEDPDGFVSGLIRTTDGTLMNDVTVTATATDGNSIATVTEDGSFDLILPKNNTYSIRPEMDTNPLNGVSTFDLVLISKHILGLQSFNSPYQYIAADVNQSGTISAYDLVQLRQLILSITSKFPDNTSWKFVDESYEFTQTNTAMENYPETIEISNMEDLMQIGFMAVKIGDVNQSASFNQAATADSRSLTPITVREQELMAGQTYTVDFTLAANTQLEGYQFTLDYANLELIEVVEATAKTYNFGYNLTKRGLLTTSWNANGAVDAISTAKLFSLVFKAQKAGWLSEQLQITSTITAAEAYDTEGNITRVKLQFPSDQPSSLQLYQNRPNPFRDITSIGFYLPEAGKADLTILDVQGKVLKEIKGTYEKGYQELQLNASDLTDKGVLYYQLTTDKKQVVKRMIVIE